MSFTELDSLHSRTICLRKPLWRQVQFLFTNRLRWPEADYLINRDRQLIYCPIAKVACSSIKRWFLVLAGDSIADQASTHAAAKRHAVSALPAMEARRVLSDNGYFTFAFIRNPWSRLVSGYLNKFLRVNSCSTRVAQLMGRMPATASGGGKLVDITFAQFVRHLASSNPARFDVHWRPQYLYLQGRRLDFLGRQEHLNDDFALLQQRLGTDSPLPCCKATRYEAAPSNRDKVADLTPRELLDWGGLPRYQQFYSDELQNHVRLIYASDIRLGNYEFGS